MSEIIKPDNWWEESRSFKKTKVEEYLNIDETLVELEKNSSVIRLEMNSIELPLFSKDPKRIKNEIKYPFKFSYGKELFNEAYRKNNHSLTLYRIYPKTISKDTIDINIAPISMKARKGVFFKPKKLHFKKVEINIPCGGTNGYQPDFRYVYNSEINTWINIAPKFKLD